MKSILTMGFLVISPFFIYPQWLLLNDDFLPNTTIIAYDSTIIAGSTSFGDYDLAITYDAGDNWTGVNAFQGQNVVVNLHAGNQWIYACTPTGLYRSDKEELSWTLYNQGLPTSVHHVIERDSILFAIADSTLFSRSLDDSLWSVLSDDIPQYFIQGLDFDGTLIVLSGSDGVCESFHMGASWALWPNIEVVTGIILIDGDNIIFASPGGVIRKRISTGQRYNVSTGLIKLWTPPPGWDYYGEFTQFHKVGNDLFLCGETGVYKLNYDSWYWEHTGLGQYTYGLTSNETHLIAVKGYTGIWYRPLDQLITGNIANPMLSPSLKVYPNPASNYIIVSADNTIQSVEVYNNFGQAVINDKPGLNSFTIVLTDLKSGLFFAHIKIEDHVFVKKFFHISGQ